MNEVSEVVYVVHNYIHRTWIHWWPGRNTYLSGALKWITSVHLLLPNTPLQQNEIVWPESGSLVHEWSEQQRLHCGRSGYPHGRTSLWTHLYWQLAYFDSSLKMWAIPVCLAAIGDAGRISPRHARRLYFSRIILWAISIVRVQVNAGIRAGTVKAMTCLNWHLHFKLRYMLLPKVGYSQLRNCHQVIRSFPIVHQATTHQQHTDDIPFQEKPLHCVTYYISEELDVKLVHSNRVHNVITNIRNRVSQSVSNIRVFSVIISMGRDEKPHPWYPLPVTHWFVKDGVRFKGQTCQVHTSQVWQLFFSTSSDVR